MPVPLVSTGPSARRALRTGVVLIALLWSASSPVRAVENDPRLWLTALGPVALPEEGIHRAPTP